MRSDTEKRGGTERTDVRGESFSIFFSVNLRFLRASAPPREIKYIFSPGENSKSKFLVTCNLLTKQASVWRLANFAARVFLFHPEKINIEK
jgi:hypothetical protein